MGDEREEERRRGGGFSWGWIIFLLVAFGQPLFGLLRRIWSGLTAGAGPGLTISADILPWLAGGFVVLAVLVGVLRALAGASSAPRSPQMPPVYGPPPTVSLPPIVPPPADARPLTATTLLPSNPLKFEPIIAPWAFGVSLLLLALLAGGLVLLFPDAALALIDALVLKNAGP